MDILLISARPDVWSPCAFVFPDKGYTLKTAASLEEGLRHIRATPPRLVILDLTASEDVRKAVTNILMINAAVHTAVVSELEEEAFHEATEGLGILMSLPASPTAADAERLLTVLSAMP